MKSPAADLFSIEFPVFAFSHCRDVVAAVTNAGGFGILGAAAHSPEELEIDLAWIDEQVDGRPYGAAFAIAASFVGKGGAALGFEDLSARVPQAQRDFASTILLEHDIEPITDVAAPVLHP